MGPLDRRVQGSGTLKEGHGPGTHGAGVPLGVDRFCLIWGLAVHRCPARHKQRVGTPLLEPKFRREKGSRKPGS